MKIEFGLNRVEEDWWFELGISFMKTDYHEYRRVFTIALGFASINIRW